MRKILLSLCVISTLALTAQYDETPPPGFTLTNDVQPAYLDVEPFDYDLLMEEAEKFEQEEGRTMNGKIRMESFNFFEKASLVETANGTQIWRLHIHSEGALALNVVFDDFNLPAGSGLWIYNEDHTYFDGPHSVEENNSHGRYMTGTVYGDDLIMEYVQLVHAVSPPRLHVSGIGFMFRYEYDPLDFSRGGGSDACQVNVNCPEGDEWQCQRDGVVRLQIVDSGNTFLCSGSLVNTTALDCRQYMLTALHCVEGISDADFQLLQCKFNYERQNCDGGPFSSSRNRTGVIHLADSNDGGGNSGSDFALFEIEDEISDAWNPFFAGWDASGTGSQGGVGIHHPSGDLKKISTYTGNLISQFVGAPGSHWQVTWTATENGHGVTEGGSSGSPIYNANKLIVGTLTGGSSFCTSPNAPDFYGKMSYHWSNNPNPASEKLKAWLNPQDNGVNTLFGAYRPCQTESFCGTIGVDENGLQNSGVTMMPNPTSGVFFVRSAENVTLNMVQIFNAEGQLVMEEKVNGPVKQLDLSAMPAGAYVVVFTTELGSSEVQRLLKY
ncbi:MAG: hypothetical protein RL226_119 [Bacteroidota bacterium]